MIKLKDLLTEEVRDEDWQALRQELLTAARGLGYTIDNSRSPTEAGAAGYDPKKVKKAMATTRKFMAKVLKLEKEWSALVRNF